MSKPAVQTYHIIDKGMRYVGAIRLKPGQKTVECTETEAKFFLEGGGLSLTDPAEAKAKAKAEAAEQSSTEGQGGQEPEASTEVTPLAGDDLGGAVVEPPAEAGKPAAAPHGKKAR